MDKVAAKLGFSNSAFMRFTGLLDSNGIFFRWVNRAFKMGSFAIETWSTNLTPLLQMRINVSFRYV